MNGIPEDIDVRVMLLATPQHDHRAPGRPYCAEEICPVILYGVFTDDPELHDIMLGAEVGLS